MVNDDYAFLQRYDDLLRALPEWTARPLFFKRVGALRASFRAGFLTEIGSPLSPTITLLGELQLCSRQCRPAANDRVDLAV